MLEPRINPPHHSIWRKKCPDWQLAPYLLTLRRKPPVSTPCCTTHVILPGRTPPTQRRGVLGADIWRPSIPLIGVSGEDQNTKGKEKYCRISRNAFLELGKGTRPHRKSMYQLPDVVNGKKNKKQQQKNPASPNTTSAKVRMPKVKLLNATEREGGGKTVSWRQTCDQ